MAVSGVDVKGRSAERLNEVLADDALEFVAELQRRFSGRRRDLLQRRRERQRELDQGGTLDFLPETREIREGDWTVAPPPSDLQKRWVEITGPTDRKMVINALNSGATGFMTDFEDSNSPTWSNMIGGQLNLTDAIERTISLEQDDKKYELNEEVATLLVRPRGWHLHEKHLIIDGEPVAGAFMDFGLYFFRNARRLLENGSGPYFYLPKMESHLEARLWNDVFTFAQEQLGIPHGTIKATVLIETIPAAFEMEEILYELRDHSAGLNAGRWDYIFSMIKCFRERPDMVLPDRNKVTMTVPFMRAYTDLLVKTCHRRGAHAMGGMAAFIPSRKTPEINEEAIEKVRADKEREAGAGFDGTWVAHPDLVDVAMEEFASVLGDRPNQVDKQRDDVSVGAAELLDASSAGSDYTDEGLRNDVNVGIQYISSWLRGNGAAAIFHMMEDAATAEISRSQVWQWVRHGISLDTGETVTHELVRKYEKEELEKIREQVGDEFFYSEGRPDQSRELFDEVALSDEFVDFLTLPAYERLED
ncbi:MAG TPA: malate synthase A [Thermoleophilaceae bacterium]|jgi:malate synthase